MPSTHNISDSAVNTPRFLASDNTSGICPEALEYMHKANAVDDASYGDDDWTAKARSAMQELFETDCSVFFVFNGTAANAVSLATLVKPYQSIICHAESHINSDECSAPEFFSDGSKLLTLPGESGRITPAGIEALASRSHGVHFALAKAVSLTQATEFGTVYSLPQLEEIGEVARQYGLRIHMDGARFANACASLDATPAELSWRAGVDILCFSGTKNGLAFGEAVVIFDRTLAEEFAFRRKRGGQLASKMRYITAPWLGLIETGAWLNNARHANAMAQRIANGVADVADVHLMQNVQANGIFLIMPPWMQEALRARQWQFHNFFAADRIRLVCGWNTTPELVDTLIADIHEIADENAE